MTALSPTPVDEPREVRSCEELDLERSVPFLRERIEGLAGALEPAAQGVIAGGGL